MDTGLNSLNKIANMLLEDFKLSSFFKKSSEIVLKTIDGRCCCLLNIIYSEENFTCVSICHSIPEQDETFTTELEKRVFNEIKLHEIKSEKYFLITSADFSEIYFPIHTQDILSYVLYIKADCLSENIINFLLCYVTIIELCILYKNIIKQRNEIFNFVKDPFYISDKNGKIVFWNDAVEKLLSDKQDIYNHQVNRKFNSFDIGFVNVCSKQIDNEEDLRFQEMIAKRAKTHKNDYKNLYNLNGISYAKIYSLYDILQIRQTEAELHKLRFIGRMINDFNETGILAINNDGITYYNTKLLELLGLPRNHKPALKDLLGLVGKSSDDEAKKLLSFVKPLIHAMLPDPPSVEFLLIDGSEPRNLRCSAQRDSGDAQSILVIFTDITRECRLIAQAKENEMKVLRADRLSALGVLAAGLAHEIAQPLGTIKVVADTCLYGQSKGWARRDEDHSEQFRIISEQAGRMAKVIEGVRIFSRDEREQDSAICDLNEAITNVMTLLEQQFSAHGIHVGVNCHEGLLMVGCGLGRLEQVLINLLVNSRQALDASEYGYKEIIVTARRRDDSAWLTVEDNGPGIDKNAFPHIFDPFYTTKEIGQGTGLGLSICKAIVNGAGGDIEVSNKYAGGCVFQVTIPLVEPRNENITD
ncbi:hypothetical protein HMPREF0326_01817 [Desulfovibrio sp. 3_1_syn3]|uniref:sensor histidine kinase n=1 Tax=Desulfovibrio sp. 3_1_syn3 TaxID=457398 RepID=UPI0001E124A1|nr:PAS domain-containing sensor histidine kinase [Desulfovibrio sp. 3_1_syn3]EFL86114.1 hypothetical protein HMPREF0326_01817 [Desulfovibrio sp. 3_1_syn3]